jgi:hypothetical protein
VISGQNYRVRVVQNNGTKAAVVDGPELLRFNWTYTVAGRTTYKARAAVRLEAWSRLQAAGIDPNGVS